MQHGLRSTSALAIIIAMCSAGVACGPRNPPTLRLSDAKPLQVPMPAPPKDASLFGYFKIRDVKQTVDLFGGPLVLAAASARGLNLGELEPGKPAALYLWDPNGSESPWAMPAVALLPIPPEGELAGSLKEIGPSMQIEAAGGGALAAMNEAAAARAREPSTRGALTEILDAPLPFDGLLYINSATIIEKYIDAWRAGLRARAPLLAAASMARKDAPSPKTMLSMLEGFLNAFQSLRAVAVGAKPYDGGIEISTLVQEEKPGPGGPIAAPDLAQFLPPADLRVVWNSRDLRRLVDFYLRIYGQMLDEVPGLRPQVQALIDEWLKATKGMDSAMAWSFGGDKTFRGQGIMRVDNPAAVQALMQKAVQLFNQGPVHDVYKGMGIDLQIVQKPKVRKLRGFFVDRYEYRLQLGQELTDPTVRLVWEKLGGMVYEVARIGPYLVYAMNGSIDAVVNSLFTGKGENPMKALSAFPAGGHLYVEANLPGLLSGMKSLLPPAAADRIPTLPPQPEPVSLFGYDSGETGYYKLRLPGPLLAAIAAAFR